MVDPVGASGAVVDVGKSIWRRVFSWINSIRKLETHTTILTKNTELLAAQEADLRRVVRKASEQGKEASNVVVVLLDQAVEVIGEVKDIASTVQQNRRCFFDFRSRSKLAKRVVKSNRDVDTLLEKISQFESELVVDKSPSRALAMPTPPLIGTLTVEKNMSVILKSLRDPSIGTIGVYGMGGSGKTTTMKAINNQLAETDEFDQIIWATVSRDMQLDNVQDQIAEQLHLDLATCTNNVSRVARLFNRLKQAQKLLIILDDMWQRISLEDVGIPHPNRENHCKIVVTTRSLEVCRGMETGKDIKLALLTEEEEWNLFLSKAGEEVLTSEIRPLAEQVAHECGGLPLAINTVGRAMRQEEDLRVWKSALEDLKNSSREITGMEDEVFTLLRFSYNRLRNDTLRKCFLYAALYPEDYRIPKYKLIWYWVGDNLIKEKDDLESEVNEGHRILKDLVDACLFEKDECEESYYVKMHDILRDLAISIMREEGGVLVKAGLALPESPTKNEWDSASKISLVKNQIRILQDHPDCPDLSILLLWENPVREIILPAFFNQMPSLQVLDLSSTELIELPSSLSDLVNLRALFLKKCGNLKKIPSLTQLKKLRVLNLSRTSIREVTGVEGLISLRSLDLSCTYRLETCTTFRLPHLEELCMQESSIFLNMNSSTITQCMEDFDSLKCLRVLALSLGLDDYINMFTWVLWEELKNFDIRICDPVIDKYPLGMMMMGKYVCLQNQKIFNYRSALLLPPNTQELHLLNCEIPRLTELLCLRNLRFVKETVVQNCKLRSGDCLILGDEMEEYTFTSLERLTVEKIDEVTVLGKSMAPHGCLRNLKILDVKRCGEMKSVIFINLVQHLKNIENIRVEGCRKLRFLVGSDGEGSEFGHVNSTMKITLPRLRTLTLQYLPKLQSISRQMLVCVSLLYINVYKCPKLKSLCFSKESFSNLQEIGGEIRWWDSLEWDDPNTKTLLDPRFTATDYSDILD